MNQLYFKSGYNNTFKLETTKSICLFLIVFIFYLTPNISFGQSYSTPGNYTFTVPLGVNSITVEAWGGGGGGESQNGGGGSGGGGGGYAKSTLTVIPGNTYSFTVGSGGLSNTNGSDSSFDSTVLVAKGGQTARLGGTGNAGSTIYNGGIGGNNPSNSNKGGAGGGSGAGRTINGNAGTNVTGNSGTSAGASIAGGGAGGNGGSDGNNGIVGMSPGGGGGGGGKGASGGNGGDGLVSITLTCPTYTLSSTAATPVCGSGSSSITLTSTSIPNGIYTVTYNTTNPTTSGNIAAIIFSGNTGSFSTVLLSASSTMTITRLSTGISPQICSSNISSNNTALVTVNSATVGGSVSGGATICSGNTSNSLTLSGQTGSITKWQKSVSPFTTWTDVVNTTATYSPGVLTTTTRYRAVVQNGNCLLEYSAYTTVTVNSPISPTIGTIIPEKCNTLGSVVLNSLPVSGTINQTGSATASYTITATSMLISNLAPGSYTFSTTIGSCTSPVSNTVTIIGTKTNTFNGVWDNGTTTTNQKIVFSADYNLDEDVNGCSCIVTGNKNVVIKSGRTLLIINDIKVNGTLKFEDNASLVQINNTSINSGNITYNRNTTSLLPTDYTYWSSPVLNQSLNISPSYSTGMFYSYNDFATPEDWKKEASNTIMQTGKGYISRSTSQTGLGIYNASFYGEPNNGIKPIAIGPLGTSNLLGNPYPSALDADLFLAANSSVIEGTIYLWTHNTAIQMAINSLSSKLGSGSLAYSTDDYATYNGTGGVGVIGGVVPSGKIAAGQAFFTTSKASNSSVTFNNTMRVVGNNSQFFKIRNPKSSKTIEKNRLWLNLTNNQGAFKQTLVGYLTDATNDYDERFDGVSFDGNEFVDFYSINHNKHLTIQGRALPFDENDEVPLGFKTTIEGSFIINIDQVDGSLINQNIFIEDKLTNSVIDLKSGSYTFKTESGTFNDRFLLHYTNNSTLNVESVKEEGILTLYSNNYKVLIVRNYDVFTTVESIGLYSLTGQQIEFWDVKNNLENNIDIPIPNINTGIYIVKVKTINGVSVKKIIVN